MSSRSRLVGWAALGGCLSAMFILSVDVCAATNRQVIISHSRELISEAQTAFAAGQADTALARLESVLTDDPDNPDAFYFMGIIKLSFADTSGAEAVLLEGVKLAPLSRRLKLLLARIWVEAGRPDEAEQLVLEVMSIRPRDLDALYIKGLIALARNDSTAAVEIWDTALTEELGGGER